MVGILYPAACRHQRSRIRSTTANALLLRPDGDESAEGVVAARHELERHRGRTRVDLDAVQCISMSINNLYLKNPTPTAEDIESEIRVLHDASITHVVLDPKGKPVDLYGTPFRVHRDVQGKTQKVVATSAGPDRRFDTPDDLSYTTTEEIPPPKKP